MNPTKTPMIVLSRRRALGSVAALGALALAGRLRPSLAALSDTRAASGIASDATVQASCSLTAAVTEGPYWVDEALNRHDVTGGSSLAAVAKAVPLHLGIDVVNAATCLPLAGVQVDIWHCHAAGSYSDENQPSNGASTLGQTWLRGYQVSSNRGNTLFRTIYPGWYRGRTPHIHVRARYFDNAGDSSYDWTTQLFFDDSLSRTVFANAPYTQRGTGEVSNATDNLYTAATQLGLSVASQGGYSGAITLGLDLTTPDDALWQDSFE